MCSVYLVYPNSKIGLYNDPIISITGSMMNGVLYPGTDNLYNIPINSLSNIDAIQADLFNKVHHNHPGCASITFLPLNLKLVLSKQLWGELWGALIMHELSNPSDDYRTILLPHYSMN